MIGAKELSKMKPGVRIINCARGGLIDEDALYKAVESGKVAGAAVDVFSNEPVTDSILFKSDKIIVTPHLGASTIEAQAGVALEVAEQVLAVLKGQPARYAVMLLRFRLSCWLRWLRSCRWAQRWASWPGN